MILRKYHCVSYKRLAGILSNNLARGLEKSLFLCLALLAQISMVARQGAGAFIVIMQAFLLALSKSKILKSIPKIYRQNLSPR